MSKRYSRFRMAQFRRGSSRPSLKSHYTKKARFRPRGFRKGYDRSVGFYGRFAKTGELKFHDVDTVDAVVATAGFINAALCTIAEGTTESTRIGRKITIKSINWRFNLELPSAAGAGGSAAGDTIRVMMVLDKQANGATVNVGDILETANFQSFNQLVNKDRFRTLMDRTYDIGANGFAGDGGTNDTGLSTMSDTFFKKCNINIQYNGNTGAITEVKSNNLHVLLISSNGLVGFDGKMRLRYTDG